MATVGRGVKPAVARGGAPARLRGDLAGSRWDLAGLRDGNLPGLRGGNLPGLRGGRAVALALTILITAIATLFGAPGALAQPSRVPTRAPGDLCSVEEWQADFRKCVDRLADVGKTRTDCLTAPTPSAPDSGLGGWFSSRPHLDPGNGVTGFYTLYGYSGYSYTTYDIGCISTLMHPDYKFENTIANGEFMISTAIIGAANALRERAWSPQTMWGWADPLVEQATQSIYRQVFTVFGVITLAVVGLYLLWRSRQSDMSTALTTAGWALLVMVAVTALALWPVRSANLADTTLTTTLDVVHSAVGPRSKSPDPATCIDPARCEDRRSPALRASDTSTESMLYRNWLRGVLGSADSLTAQKYGRALYDARSLTWEEAERLRTNPGDRDATFALKNRQWMKVAEQIQREDPEAYEYLKGTQGMERIGAGFIAILAALFFALFDIVASVLVLLGFLIFRWAVIAAPILGTVGLLRPASAGIRRLANAVVAAIFNIAIFGTGAAVYLFAVDLIMSTASLPGWLQVVLVWLCGLVGWLLLRPYRRITQLGGKDSTSAITSAGSWHRRFFGDLRDSKLAVSTPGGTNEPEQPARQRPGTLESRTVRPEARVDDAIEVRQSAPPARAGGAERPRPSRRHQEAWTEPDVPDGPPSYSIYRPDSGETTVPNPNAAPSSQQRVRAEAR
jgi:hypothetical protein